MVLGGVCLLNFLKNYSFLFTTIVSATIAITLYFKNKKKKQLSFDLDSWDTIVTKLNHDIKIFYKDNTEITDDLNMILIKFRNTGNEPIKKDDFENDLFLKLLDSKVFDVSVTATKPEGLIIETYKDESESRIGIKPLLLNPKDEFTVKILTSKLIPTFTINTRIIGGSIVEYKKVQKSFWKISGTIFEGIMYALGGLIFVLLIVRWIMSIFR